MVFFWDQDQRVLYVASSQFPYGMLFMTIVDRTTVHDDDAFRVELQRGFAGRAVLCEGSLEECRTYVNRSVGLI